MTDLRILKRARSLRPGFPCLWCGESFVTRANLDVHWQASPVCRRNRKVVRSDRPDAQVFGQRPVQPGEPTLRLVRRRTSE